MSIQVYEFKFEEMSNDLHKKTFFLSFENVQQVIHDFFGFRKIVKFVPNVLECGERLVLGSKLALTLSLLLKTMYSSSFFPPPLSPLFFPLLLPLSLSPSLLLPLSLNLYHRCVVTLRSPMKEREHSKILFQKI